MTTEVTMPELGESVTEGTVTRWLKRVGDTVALDEPLLEVSTDKVDTEIPSPASGTLLELLVAEDDTVAVGGLLARVGAADAPPQPEPVPSQPEPAAAPAPRRTDPAQPRPRASEAPTPGAVTATPTRPGSDDREGPATGTTAPLPRLRQIIAQRMTSSLATSAQLTTVQEVDVTRLVRLRARHKADLERREGVKLTFLPFIAKAVVEALAAFPMLNASISEDGRSVTYHDAVHLAIAVDTDRGLLVPVIRDAQNLGVVGLARGIAELADRTRGSSITADELTGGTFTITNIGSVGAQFDTPIINQPQVAILATGAIRRRPAVVTGPDGEDQIAIRSLCHLPMTYDHRLVDGADAGRFVSAVRARLEEGAFERELG
jgi:pyruvate dehydrogenase E2 component (dihydrolipoamide acetyltransferase)